MPTFLSGSAHKAIVTLSNPKSAGFDYKTSLRMGVDLIEMASASFHLDPGQSKTIEIPVTMPTPEGTYPVYLANFSSSVLVPPVYRATEDVVIPGGSIGAITWE